MNSGARRLVLWVEYEGTDFNGWQFQPGQRTVQGELEGALARMCGEEVRLIAAGRTDSGVHALGQVAHFSTLSTISPEKFLLGLNTLIGRDVTLVDCREAKGKFHAQFDALSKTYCYRILHRRSPSALLRNRTWHLKSPLSVDQMREAAERLKGEHDFAAFCGAGGSETSKVRRIERLEVREEGEEIRIKITGKGFLRQMVRIIVGTLVEVGKGERTADSMTGLLASRDRRQAGYTAPPHGLCLLGVDYGDKMPLPAYREMNSRVARPGDV